MANVMVMQGRKIDESDMGMNRGLPDANPGWNRTRLSRDLCARWNWHNAQGRPKDMAAREPIRGALRDLCPLTMSIVAPGSADARLFNGLLALIEVALGDVPSHLDAGLIRGSRHVTCHCGLDFYTGL